MRYALPLNTIAKITLTDAPLLYLCTSWMSVVHTILDATTANSHLPATLRFGDLSLFFSFRLYLSPPALSSWVGTGALEGGRLAVDIMHVWGPGMTFIHIQHMAGNDTHTHTARTWLHRARRQQHTRPPHTLAI